MYILYNMSVLINEPPIVAWKDQANTFLQISAGIRYNSLGTLHDKGMFKALPLKIYRREIATQHLGTLNPRSSGRISAFERPGGTTTSNNADCTGISNTTEINVSTEASLDTIDNACSVFLSPDDNARRRVRSSGMITKKFDNNRNAPKYFTNSQQYLESRSLSYKSNSNFHVYSGDVTVKPGSAMADKNLYSSNNSHSPCTVFVLSVAGSFKYLWIDNTEHTVNVPVGSYSINDFNSLLHNTMALNFHYFQVPPSDYKTYLMNMKYNATTNKIYIETVNVIAANIGATWIPSMDPNNVTYNWWDAIPNLITTPLAVVTNVRLVFQTDTVSNSQLYTAIGINTMVGDVQYPTLSTDHGTTSFSGTTSLTASKGVQIYYKPSNPGFATQGAVSSSDLIARRRYNAITTAGGTLRNSYGAHTASAVAYGVHANGYTVKDKIGYPMKQTPTFSKYSDIMKKCSVRTFSNAI
jgi:hypothetical protein